MSEGGDWSEYESESEGGGEIKRKKSGAVNEPNASESEAVNEKEVRIGGDGNELRRKAVKMENSRKKEKESPSIEKAIPPVDVFQGSKVESSSTDTTVGCRQHGHGISTAEC